MVHPVVARRVENKFKPPRQTVDRFGVEEELVGCVKDPAKNNQYRIKAD